MGVITKSNITSPKTESIEDVFESIENIENNQEPEVRRPRKIKQRASKLPALESAQSTSGKSGKKKKRVDNSNFLLSLADPDDIRELTIQDFIPSSISVFTELFLHRESIKVWNEFIDCSRDDEQWFQQNAKPRDSNAVMDTTSDRRKAHPAYAAIECFHKIDGDLRHLLKKRHSPIGALIHFEQELVTFFVNRPNSVYHCPIPNSFERLMVHAISQYLDLSSLSYDRNGARWTRVKNKKPDFQLPPVLLSTYLDKRSNNTVH